MGGAACKSQWQAAHSRVCADLGMKEFRIDVRERMHQTHARARNHARTLTHSHTHTQLCARASTHTRTHMRPRAQTQTHQNK